MTEHTPSGDEQVLRMLAGANFGPNARLTLPSGKTLDAAEAQAMTSLYAPDVSADRPDDPESADDALLDTLGDRDTEHTDALAGDPLAALALAWRREVDSRPVGVLVDTDTALAAIAAARPHHTAWRAARDFAARAAFRLTHRLRTPRSTR